MSTPSDIHVHLKPLVQQLRNPRLVATAALVGLSSLWLRNNYLDFKATGPGGLPYNVGGWLGALFLKLFARETTGTKEYDADENKETYLGEDLPQRQGGRPKGGFHVVPARQREQIPGKDVMEVRVLACIPLLPAEGSMRRSADTRRALQTRC